MLNKITIKYFQSHKITRLALSKGVNGIIGMPNSGKTAIIRAIQLLMTNKPAGFRYHNDSTKNPNTEIHIKPNNEPVVKFKKNKSSTIFSVGNEEYKTGKFVPEEITNALNLSDINFGLQLGMPFLVLSSPPEIARQINKATESEVLSRCIKETNDRIKILKIKRKALIENIDSTSQKLKPYKNIHKAKPYIDKAQKIDNKINAKRDKINKLEDIQEFIHRAKKLIRNQKKPLSAKSLVSKAEKIERKMERLSTTSTILRNIQALKHSVKLAEREKKHLIDKYIRQLKEQKKCPTCYSDINFKTIKTLKKELKNEGY